MDRRVEALGPTGARVGARLHELRGERRLTLGDLASKLEQLGRPILLSALSKIEKGQRRVDVDDLVALALALDVSPNTILLPAQARIDTDVKLTPSHVVDTASAWRWAARDQPIQSADLDIDYFISYTQADEAWATWIAWVLENEGYRVMIQAWDFVPGSNWAAATAQGIQAATRMIAVLSEQYLDSQWATEEWRAALASDVRGDSRRLLPVRVDHCKPRGLLAAIVYVDLADQDEHEARTRLLGAIASLRTGRTRPSVTPAFPA